MCQYLLLRGLNPHLSNKLLATPLYYAIESGNEEIVTLLCKDKRIHLDHQDKFGDTILHVAAREGHEKFCKMFLELGERTARIKNQMGHTALILAVSNGWNSTAEVLRQYDTSKEAGFINEVTAFNNLVEKLINDPVDTKIKIPGQRAEKIQIFSTKKISRQDLLDDEEKKKAWHARLMEKREKAVK